MNWKLSKKTVTKAFKASNHAKAEHNSNVCVLSAVEVCSCQAQRQTCGMCLHYVQRGQLVTRDSVTSTKQQSEDLSAWIKTFVCVHIHNLFNQSIVTNGSLRYFCFLACLNISFQWSISGLSNAWILKVCSLRPLVKNLWWPGTSNLKLLGNIGLFSFRILDIRMVYHNIK